MASSVVSAPRLFRSGGNDGRHLVDQPGPAAVDRVGAERGCWRPAGKMPGVPEPQQIAVGRALVHDPRRAGGPAPPAGNRGRPSRGRARTTNRLMMPAGAASSKQRLDRSQDPGAASTRWPGAQERPCASRYASACMREVPRLRSVSIRPGRDPRTGGTRTKALLHCTTRNSRVPAGRTRSRESPPRSRSTDRH